MKRILALLVTITLIFAAGCEYSSAEQIVLGSQASSFKSAPTESVMDVNEDDIVKYTDLGLDLHKIADIAKKHQELDDFLTIETDSFTISKCGSNTRGCVCFSSPNETNISVVYFLAYEGASRGSIPTQAAQNAQKSVVSYCSDNSIEVEYSDFVLDSSLIFYVAARDSLLPYEELPITLNQFRSDKEFFSNEKNLDSYSQMLLACDYSGLYDLISDFIKNNEVVDTDPVTELHEKIDEISELSKSCDITYDEFEKTTVVNYKNVDAINAKTYVVPRLLSNKYGASVEYEMGFRKKGWLFFDKIIIITGEDSDEASFDYYETNRDIISGSTIKEYVFDTYFDEILKAAADNEQGAIRFTNSDTKKTVEHTFSTDELKAVKTLENIAVLHKDMLKALDKWENE